jgi:deoxyribonuclease V
VARYAAVDVYYPEHGAVAAIVVAADPRYATLVAEHTVRLASVAAYRPGAFHERELPAITAAVGAVGGPVDLLVVDGYVTLDPRGRPGLGAHAHAALHLPVIGVAKNAFRTATHAVDVYRGGSGRPLFVTAAGIEVAEAADLVRNMAGAHRVPAALRRVDALSRAGTARPARSASAAGTAGATSGAAGLSTGTGRPPAPAPRPSG